MKKFENVVKGLLIGAVAIVGIVVNGQQAEAKTRVNYYSTESSFVQDFDNGDRIVEYNNVIECYDVDNNIVYSVDTEKSEDFYIIDTYYREDNTQITVYSNNSTAVVNRDDNQYLFYASELGDWDYTCNDVDELNNLILSYKECYADRDNSNEFYVTDTYMNGNKTIVEYNDKSCVVMDSVNDYYEFVPAITEDWSIEFNNVKDLNNCIATYKSLKENGWY